MKAEVLKSQVIGAVFLLNNNSEELNDVFAGQSMYSFHCTTQPRRFEAFKINFPVFFPLQLISHCRETHPFGLLAVQLAGGKLASVHLLGPPGCTALGCGPGHAGRQIRSAAGPERQRNVTPLQVLGWLPSPEGRLPITNQRSELLASPSWGTQLLPGGPATAARDACWPSELGA